MKRIRAAIRRLIPQIKACLDETPRVGQEAHDFMSSQRFAGWAYHPQGVVELRFELDGKPLDIFYPNKVRKDVFEHLESSAGSLNSGFIREVSPKAFELLSRSGAQLVARCSAVKTGRAHRVVLWSGDAADGSDEQLEEELRIHFPIYAQEHEPEIPEHLQLVVLGDIPSDFLSMVLSEASLSLGVSPQEVWCSDLSTLPKSLSVYARECNPNADWNQFLSNAVTQNSWILFLDGRRTLTAEGIQAFFRTARKESRISLFRPVHENERVKLAGTPLAGLSDFDSIWLGKSSVVATLGAGKKISQPLASSRAHQIKHGIGVGVLDAVYTRDGLKTVQEHLFSDSSMSLGIVLPYLFGSQDSFDVQRDVFLKTLLRNISTENRKRLAFITSDTRHAGRLSFEGVPIYSSEELVESYRSHENVEGGLHVLATDCWSVRTCHLLAYCIHASIGVIEEPLSSEDWYPELRHSSTAGNPTEWARWKTPESLSISQLDSFFQKSHNAESGRSFKQLKTVGEHTTRISFIIPVFNAIEHVLMCVRSVLPQLQSDDELVLVNDCSDLGTSAALKSLAATDSRMKLVEREKNGGFIEACYSGLEVAESANDIVLLNSDVICSQGLVVALHRALRNCPGAYLFSPFSTGSRKLQLDVPPGESLETMASYVAQSRSPSYPTVITPEGQCLLIRREAISEMGFFDRVYHRGFCEESDYAMRLFLHGGDMVVVDDALIYHEQSASFGSKQRMIQLARNRPIFDHRWGIEYEMAFEAYQHRSDVELIKEELLSSEREQYSCSVEHGEETAFVRRVEVAKKQAVTTQPEAMWLDNAEVVFILPSIVGGGGSLSVLQHINELLLQGVEARVITLGKQRLDDFPLLTKPVPLTPEEVLSLPWGAQHVVATFWTTAHLVHAVVERYQTVHGYYYIQDYEPWFYDHESPLISLAEKTYQFPLTKVAKTQFLCDTVKKNHDVEVQKITPGIDRLVFYPGEDRTQFEHAPHFVAMYRPSTPRRGSDRLLPFLQALRERFPEAQISLFGDTDAFPLALSDRVSLLGRLSRKKVAELYRNADFVLDFSYFHGFGRSGIEAMSCGAIPILTESGGVSEYAIDNENSLMIDSDRLYEEIGRIIELWGDSELRRVMRQSALKRASRWSEWKASRDWSRLMGITPPNPDTYDICRYLFHRDERLEGVERKVESQGREAELASVG